jgi:hypothetical protein
LSWDEESWVEKTDTFGFTERWDAKEYAITAAMPEGLIDSIAYYRPRKWWAFWRKPVGVTWRAVYDNAQWIDAALDEAIFSKEALIRVEKDAE